MADYIASALLAAQLKIAPKFTEAEMREIQNPILRVGLANQNFLVKNVEEIKKSDKRAVKGYQFKKRAAGNGTTRSHNFSGSQGDTVEVDLAWATLSETFGSYMTAGSDNIFSTQQQIEHGLRECMRILRERMGAGLVTAIHAGRTGVAPTTVRNASFNDATNAFEISNQAQFFAYIRSVLNQNKYYGDADVIVDSIMDPIARMIAAQGSSNGNNLSYQLQGLNIMPHNILGTDVAVSAYPNGGLAIALPKNSFAFIPWIGEKYLKGSGNFMDYNGGYASVADDTGLPITYSLRGWTEKADGSGNGGTTDDLKTNWQLSVDIDTEIAYLSEADATPIHEFALTA